MKIKYGVLVLALLLTCVTFGKNLVGQKAPEIVIDRWMTLDPPDIEQLGSRVYVLEFWATWCHSCVKHIPHLKALNDKYSKQGLIFISLSQDRNVDDLKKCIEKEKIDYPVALDKGTTDWYKVRSYPTAVVVGHDGIIKWQGFPWSKDFEKEIQKALKKAPAPVSSDESN